MRKVILENDYRLNQAYFRDWETRRAIRIDSILSTERAWAIAHEKGWQIVMFTTMEHLPKMPGSKGFLERVFSFLRRK